MEILLVILLAIVIVMILVMLSSVYQMNRDFHRRMGELAQKYAGLEHKVEYLERITMKFKQGDAE